METDICQILFCIFACLALICSIAVVAARNPVNSAMNMALCFGFTAAILFGMGAQFLGIVQIIVYAGAILVLFLFIIMMLDVKAEERSVHSLPTAIIGVVVAAFFAALVTKIAINLPGATDNPCPVCSLCERACTAWCGECDNTAATQPAAEPKAPAGYGGKLPELCPKAAALAAGECPETANAIPDTKLIGLTLFGKYNIPFAILSFALLAGTVGAIAISRKLRQD